MLFDKIISISEEAAHRILLEAFKNIVFDKYKEKCEYIIRKFFDTESESIGRQYELGFLKANPSYFYQIYDLIVAYTQSKVGKYRGHYFYEYLHKCIVDEDTALKCLALVKDFNKHEEPNFQKNSLRDEPLQVVIKCYHTIRDYSDNQEVLEQILDVFDEVLKNPAYRNQMDEVLELI